MDYSDLTNPIFSEKVFNTYIKEVVGRIEKGLHINIVSYRGAGKPTELSFILENQKINRIFLWLDISELLNEESLCYKNAISLFFTRYKSRLDKNITLVCDHLNKKDTITYGDFAAFIDYLVKEEKITLIIKNAGNLYSVNGSSESVAPSIVYNLWALNKDKISLLFLTDREFDNENMVFLGDLSPMFFANLIWGKDLFFEEDSIISSLSTYENNLEITFSNDLIIFFTEYLLGEPTTLKYVVYSIVSDPSLQVKLEHCKDVSTAYDLIGSIWLNARFNHIINNISLDTLKAIKEDAVDSISPFAIKTGLSNESLKLFRYFLDSKYKPGIISQGGSSKKDVRVSLSGQELLIFNLLSNNLGEVISRDSIAQVLWQDTWEEKYSDWAIDKVMSRLRSSLSEKESEFTLKTIKNRGFVLL